MKSFLPLLKIGIIGFAVIGSLAVACPDHYPLRFDEVTVPNGTAQIDVGQTVTLDGEDKFYCPDLGQIVEYRWILPPQTYCVQGQDTSELKCKFYPAGVYVVELQVKCSHNYWNTLHPLYPEHNRYFVTVAASAAGGPWYVRSDGDDENDGRSWQKAFRTIQTAINSAGDANEIIVGEGLYQENISLRGKDVFLHSTYPEDWLTVQNTILDGQEQGATVFFEGTETSGCRLEGLTVRGGWNC